MMMSPSPAGPSRETGDRTRLHAVVTGRVQGVGYRFFAQERAVARGLAGTVRNLPGGSVEVEAEGPRPALDAYLGELREGPPAARVSDVTVRWLPAQGARDFVIRTSREL
ncbi:MAG TPA: acylphosphatase [Candidatus Eisenbacteria bacterium]|nr:acylphosphatase [Candidatus Eisenbacteria bacterium]